MKIEDLAKICHQANKAYCETINDFSQLDWENAPAWQKESIVLGVKFQLNNPDSHISASHEEWMNHKIKEGWIWGAIKDSEKKTHPCLIPYNWLPLTQQIKDHLIKNICLGLSCFVTEKVNKSDL